MDKTQTLESIKNAKRVHEAQMSRLQAAIQGCKIDNPTPVSKMECCFGLWLYDEKNHLRDIVGSLFYDNIEVLHTQWHHEYFKLYEILFKEEKKGFLSNVIGSTNLNEMQIDKAKLYYSEIEVTSKKLLKVLGSAERRICALQESKFY